jgi:dTMP kinase
MLQVKSKGLFITFEGGEGVGKTTQIKRLEASLKDKKHDVIVTREPGGTPAAEEVRSLLSHEKLGGYWTPNAELMLLNAARAMHIRDVIQPALEEDKIVLCDRYIDSTRVYQGYLARIDMNFIMDLERQIVGTHIPDLTFVMDLDAEKAMERVQSRGAMDHYDRGDLALYQKLRDGFLSIAKDNSNRCTVMDADQDEQKIAEMIFTMVEERL